MYNQRSLINQLRKGKGCQINIIFYNPNILQGIAFLYQDITSHQAPIEFLTERQEEPCVQAKIRPLVI